MRCLFTVTDRFVVTGKGLVLVPGLRPRGKERFKVGDKIRLLRPDGRKQSVCIDGLEFPHPNPESEVLILFGDLSKDDVPVGTEVWSVDTEPD